MMWACTTVLSVSQDIYLYPYQKWLQVATGARRRYEDLRRNVDVVLENIIDSHVPGTGGEGGAECLLSVLLKLECQGDLTMDNVKGVMMDVVVAGFKPASKTAVWAMAEMARNPTIMKKKKGDNACNLLHEMSETCKMDSLNERPVQEIENESPHIPEISSQKSESTTHQKTLRSIVYNNVKIVIFSNRLNLLCPLGPLAINKR
ncbi:hypothetical protein K1719_013323 [Acacia pycnantha]|nr:hypothetical protein K1719_013323 [Acacia pycnantha]